MPTNITIATQVGPGDHEPNLLCTITCTDNSTLIARINSFNLTFESGTFFRGDENIAYHDNLFIRIPNTHDYDITNVLSFFHTEYVIQSIEIEDQDSHQILYENNGYWNTIYTVRNVTAMDNTISDYELVFCHKA